MSDVLIKCSVCGAVLDEEDLFCPNCGTEAPIQTSSGDIAPATDGSAEQASAIAEKAPPTHLVTCNFTCQGCGASMSYDASAQTLRCPFCGSEKLEKNPDEKEIAPDGVVPFATSRDEAIANMR